MVLFVCTDSSMFSVGYGCEARAVSIYETLPSEFIDHQLYGHGILVKGPWRLVSQINQPWRMVSEDGEDHSLADKAIELEDCSGALNEWVSIEACIRN